MRFSGQPDAPWIGDITLQDEIGEAIKGAELARTLELVVEWRRGWERVMEREG